MNSRQTCQDCGTVYIGEICPGCGRSANQYRQYCGGCKQLVWISDAAKHNCREKERRDPTHAPSYGTTLGAYGITRTTDAKIGTSVSDGPYVGDAADPVGDAAECMFNCKCGVSVMQSALVFHECWVETRYTSSLTCNRCCAELTLREAVEHDDCGERDYPGALKALASALQHVPVVGGASAQHTPSTFTMRAERRPLRVDSHIVNIRGKPALCTYCGDDVSTTFAGHSCYRAMQLEDIDFRCPDCLEVRNRLIFRCHECSIRPRIKCEKCARVMGIAEWTQHECTDKTRLGVTKVRCAECDEIIFARGACDHSRDYHGNTPSWRATAGANALPRDVDPVGYIGHATAYPAYSGADAASSYAYDGLQSGLGDGAARYGSYCGGSAAREYGGNGDSNRYDASRYSDTGRHSSSVADKARGREPYGSDAWNSKYMEALRQSALSERNGESRKLYSSSDSDADGFNWVEGGPMDADYVDPQYLCLYCKKVITHVTSHACFVTRNPRGHCMLCGDLCNLYQEHDCAEYHDPNANAVRGELDYEYSW